MFIFKEKNNNLNNSGTSFYKAAPKNSNGYHCKTCKHCVESGNGCYTCFFGKPIQIVKTNLTTNQYFWCNGRYYISK